MTTRDNTGERKPERPLRGRDAEVRAIHDALHEARNGRGSVVLAEGGRGLGKSRLLREATDAAIAAGFRVATAAAPAELSELAQRGPLLVCIDDLHRADRETLAALRVLPGRLPSAPIVWLAAYPNRRTSPDLMDLVDLLHDHARTLVLQPLDERAVEQLLVDIVGAEPAPGLLEYASRAGGNPRLLVELLGGLVDEGRVQIIGGRAELERADVPQCLGDFAREELARVSPLARHAVSVASVLGGLTSFDLLTSMLATSPASLLAPVEELVQAEMIVDDGQRLDFPCSLLREAVASTLSPPVRRSLERQAIGALIEAGDSPLELAHRVASSSEPGDRAAISTVAAAARMLRSSDAQAAAALSVRAIELCDPGATEYPGLISEGALLLHAAGRAIDGKDLAVAALRAGLLPADEAAIGLSIARMPDLPPDTRRAAACAALELSDLPAALRARLRAEHVACVLAEGRREAARALLPQVEDDVAATGDASAALTLELARAELAYLDGNYTDGLERLELAAAPPNVDDGPLRPMGVMRAELLLAVDDIDGASRIATDGFETAERLGHASAERSWLRVQGRSLHQQGRLLDARAALDGSVDLDQPVEAMNVSDVATVALLGRIAIHVGDGRRARSLAKVAEQVVAGGVPESRRHAAWLLAAIAISDDEAAPASQRLLALAADGTESVVPAQMSDPSDLVHLARIAREADNEHLARTAATTAARWRERGPGIGSQYGIALHAIGLLERSAPLLAEAVALLSASPRGLALASALEDYGVELVRDGDPSGGADALGRALKIYSSSGATWDGSRVRRRLRDLGIRRRIVTPVRPATGWEALTDAEHGVVGLVVEGLTNREVARRLFISPHTVSMHLRHVFTKLDVNSRVELARLTLQQEIAA